MSYEVYIDVRHHPRHNEEDEQKIERAYRLADDDGTLTRAFDAGDDGPLRPVLASCLREVADRLAPDEEIKRLRAALKHIAEHYDAETSTTVPADPDLVGTEGPHHWIELSRYIDGVLGATS